MATDVVDGDRKVSLLRTYAVAAITTALIIVVSGVLEGPGAMLLTAILVVLEITFSFDNAIVNSKLLVHLNKFWQTLFMTVGILIAVFVVRFLLPIFIVQLTAGLGFTEVVNLALHNPELYAEELHKAGPLIDSFGGTFLVMIGIAYFFDAEKDVHWFKWLERRLAPLGKYDNVTIFIMLMVGLVLFFTVPADLKASVLGAAVCGIALHVGLDLFGEIVDGDEDDETDEVPSNGRGNVKKLAGVAAAVMFARLEILDASFSFDGVVGAFAITGSVVVIACGLGAGAMWVRSMTVHLLNAGALAKYKFLEHGAMWAILFLGGTMIAKLYHAELPEWATGSIGIVFIGLAVATSIISQRREARKEATVEVESANVASIA
jgi:hypothetical protein